MRLTVNGVAVELARAPDPRLLLADFLREELGLVGVHLGCEQGVCGACTVIVDGRPVKSCLMLAVQTDGARITTVEGLASNGRLSRLQEAFRAHHAVQCGFCTPGMLLSALTFVQGCPGATEREVREAIRGNLCRCTGYEGIVDAILDVLTTAREGELERDGGRR